MPQSSSAKTAEPTILQPLSREVAANQSAALAELERRVHSAITTYSNVHRGAGHFSEVTTALYERARAIVLDELGLDKRRYTVIFSSPDGANHLGAHLKPRDYQVLSSQELGLPLGIRAIAVARKALPRGAPERTGGGATRLVSPETVVWEGFPGRFEAGTPAILHAIALACAMQLTRIYGKDAFRVDATASTIAADWLYRDELATLSGQRLLDALRPTTLGRHHEVPVAHGTMAYANLDNAASSPTFSLIWETARQILRQPHAMRRATVREVEAICADFLGAPAEDYTVVFTANTTEAINHVASNFKATVDPEVQPVVLNTLLEHHSNELPWRAAADGELIRLGIDDEGFLALDQLEQLLQSYNQRHEFGRRRITLVAVSGASNVLGTFADIERICSLAHAYGARVLVDAAQLVAHRKIEMRAWGVDYLAFSGHKLYAPFGSGALVMRRDLCDADPLTWKRLKAYGEENVVGIAALGKAMLLLQRIGMSVIEAEERRLTQRALQGLSEIPGIRIWGIQDQSPNFDQRGSVIAFSIDRVPHNVVARELAHRSAIGIRGGCHCAHLLVKHLLEIPLQRPRIGDVIHELFPGFVGAMMPGIVRVSFGIGNDDADVDRLLAGLREIAAMPISRVNRMLAANRGGTAWPPRSAAKPRVDGWVAERLHRVFGVRDALGPSPAAG